MSKPIAENQKARAAGISLPLPLQKRAKKYAASKGMGLSGLVRALLIEHMNSLEAAK